MKIGVLFSAIAILFLSCVDKSVDVRYPVLGLEPIPVSLLEDQSSVLAHWMRKRCGRMTIVRLAPGHNLESVTDGAIKELRALLRDGKGGGNGQAEGADDKQLVPDEQYLFAAIKLGLIDKVYWVIPYRMFEYSDAERRVKRLLAGAGGEANAVEIGNMKLDGGCVSGRVLGVAMSICSPEALPAIPEPVLLDMDAGFLPAFAAERSNSQEYSNLRGLKELLDIITAKRIRVADACMSFSAGTPRSIGRYLGLETAEILERPDLLKTAPPELWSLRDGADALFSQGRMKEVATFLQGSLKKYPGDPSLIMFHATASALAGKEVQALGALGKLCEQDRVYCTALLYTGRELKSRNRPEAAQRFFWKALELRPGWPEAVRECQAAFETGKERKTVQ